MSRRSHERSLSYPTEGQGSLESSKSLESQYSLDSQASLRLDSQAAHRSKRGFPRSESYVNLRYHLHILSTCFPVSMPPAQSQGRLAVPSSGRQCTCFLPCSTRGPDRGLSLQSCCEYRTSAPEALVRALPQQWRSISGTRVRHAGQAAGPRRTGGACHPGRWPERSQRSTPRPPSTMAASERSPCTRLTARAWKAASTTAPPRYLSLTLSLRDRYSTSGARACTGSVQAQPGSHEL